MRIESFMIGGDARMLMAKTKNGNMFCLGDSYQKETLKTLRKKEEFFCPVCGEKVILKLGERRIFHFSHVKGGSCREFYENETDYHMEGKLKLYQWLRKQEVPAILEYYDSKIQQRPDILFQYGEQKFALEFQCSTISEEMFKKRTESYLIHGYTPFWIIGGKSFTEKYSQTASLTSFQYLFLRQTSKGQLFIPSFSPDQNTLKIFYSIYPYSKKNALIRKSALTLDNLKIEALLDPLLPSLLNMDQWKRSSEKFIMNWSLYPSDEQREFFHEVYNHYLNLFLFPSEIGLPLTYGLLIQTPPFLWQAYYYLDILYNKQPGEVFSTQRLEQSFKKRVAAKQIILRDFPQINKINPLYAYLEYTRLLEKLGVLVKKAPDLYQIQKPLIIPKTNREKEERNTYFFHKNIQILEKK